MVVLQAPCLYPKEPFEVAEEFAVDMVWPWLREKARKDYRTRVPAAPRRAMGGVAALEHVKARSSSQEGTK